ncbi:MAG: hypothetical protein WCE81_02415 [Halobacteriota archaeon]
MNERCILLYSNSPMMPLVMEKQEQHADLHLVKPQIGHYPQKRCLWMWGWIRVDDTRH